MSQNLVQKICIRVAQFFGAESAMRVWLNNRHQFDVNAIGVYKSNSMLLDLCVCEDAKRVSVYSLPDYKLVFSLTSYPDGRLTTHGTFPEW